MTLKPIQEQVAVIVGAASGIGRETALRFARRGAKVVVAARDEDGLKSLVDEITKQGGEAAYALCDVTEIAQVRYVAETAARTFGRIDTWVNVAAVSVYARFENTTPEEFRQITDVNYLGQVYGAMVALPYLREEGRGALIAIASVESLVSLPLHSAYAASKHAVEGMLDSLRRELMADGVPISVTSVKPGTINTPFFNNARTKIGVKPQGPPPIYQPDVVADCVLYAAEHPVRDLFAGGAGKMMAVTQALSPTLMDATLSRMGIPAQHTDEPKSAGEPDTMFAPQTGDSRAEGDFSNRARRFSAYTWLETHPQAKLLLAGTLLAAGTALMRGRSSNSIRRRHNYRHR